MKIRTNRNPVAQETFKAIGINEPFVCEVEDLKDQIVAGNCDGGESVFARVYPLGQNEVTESVLDSKHSLFLTTMIMRNDFWEQLTPEVRAVIKHAAFMAARNERQATIDDGEVAKVKLRAEGVDIHELTAEETADWKEKTKVVYDKFEPTFTPGLVDSIKNA
jgi:TRAP-type C4-dicarboxylate transport system substrate-binding protein